MVGSWSIWGNRYFVQSFNLFIKVKKFSNIDKHTNNSRNNKTKSYIYFKNNQQFYHILKHVAFTTPHGWIEDIATPIPGQFGGFNILFRHFYFQSIYTNIDFPYINTRGKGLFFPHLQHIPKFTFLIPTPGINIAIGQRMHIYKHVGHSMQVKHHVGFLKGLYICIYTPQNKKIHVFGLYAWSSIDWYK